MRSPVFRGESRNDEVSERIIRYRPVEQGTAELESSSASDEVRKERSAREWFMRGFVKHFTEKMWSRKISQYWVRSKWVGASCLLFLFPAYVWLSLGKTFGAILMSLITITSFMSDYYADKPTYWDPVDRIVATFTIFCSMYYVMACGTWGPLAGPVTFIALGCILQWSRDSKSSETWVFRHCLHHVAGALVGAWMGLRLEVLECDL